MARVAWGSGHAGQPRGTWGPWVSRRAGDFQLLVRLEGERESRVNELPCPIPWSPCPPTQPRVPVVPIPASPAGDGHRARDRHPLSLFLLRCSPRSLISHGVQQARMGSGLPRCPGAPGAPVVPEDPGGPGDPGDLAVLGCRTFLSPLRIRAGLSLPGTLGHLSLPVGEIQSLAPPPGTFPHWSPPRAPACPPPLPGTT